MRVLPLADNPETAWVADAQRLDDGLVNLLLGGHAGGRRRYANLVDGVPVVRVRNPVFRATVTRNGPRLAGDLFGFDDVERAGGRYVTTGEGLDAITGAARRRLLRRARNRFTGLFTFRKRGNGLLLWPFAGCLDGIAGAAVPAGAPDLSEFIKALARAPR